MIVPVLIRGVRVRVFICIAVCLRVDTLAYTVVTCVEEWELLQEEKTLSFHPSVVLALQDSLRNRKLALGLYISLSLTAAGHLMAPPISHVSDFDPTGSTCM